MTIRIADIRVEWPRIKDAVAALCFDDRPEDVYADCKHGRASLLVYKDAFAITKLETNQHSGLKVVHIWKAYAPQVMQEVEAELFDLFRSEGAIAVIMSSQRDGWASAGWEPVATIYRRAL